MPEPSPQPVSFSVAAIGHEKGEFLALVEYQGESYIVRRGDAVPPASSAAAFHVKEIHDRKVVVADPRAGCMVTRELQEE
jgi:hypothetical protein